jgi:hypothetical protein
MSQSQLQLLGIKPEDLMLMITGRHDDNVISASGCSSEWPTFRTLSEILEFANKNSSILKLRRNRILKLLLDKLFPHCTISRADRLERRILELFDDIPKDENLQMKYLEQQWKPQATSINGM